MSKVLIQQYYNDLERAKQFGKTVNESSVRNHFWNLLNHYAQEKGYEVVTEVATIGTEGKPVRPDGVLKNLWFIAAKLYEAGKLTSGQAAEMAGITRREFLESVGKFAYPSFNTAARSCSNK